VESARRKTRDEPPAVIAAAFGLVEAMAPSAESQTAWTLPNSCGENVGVQVGNFPGLGRIAAVPQICNPGDRMGLKGVTSEVTAEVAWDASTGALQTARGGQDAEACAPARGDASARPTGRTRRTRTFCTLCSLLLMVAKTLIQTEHAHRSAPAKMLSWTTVDLFLQCVRRVTPPDPGARTFAGLGNGSMPANSGLDLLEGKPCLEVKFSRVCAHVRDQPASDPRRRARSPIRTGTSEPACPEILGFWFILSGRGGTARQECRRCPGREWV
jgi:hypothetical protein